LLVSADSTQTFMKKMKIVVIGGDGAGATWADSSTDRIGA
jgi:hypothetical protein